MRRDVTTKTVATAQDSPRRSDASSDKSTSVEGMGRVNIRVVSLALTFFYIPYTVIQ